MSHTCSTALVRCMDFRLGPAIRDYINSKELFGDIDIISVAGAAKDVAQIEASYLEGQIDLSKKLHQIKTVVLMNHTDCGGYGGRAAFDSNEAERTKHEEDLRVAKEKLIAKHTDLNVILALAIISEDGEVNIEEL